MPKMAQFVIIVVFTKEKDLNTRITIATKTRTPRMFIVAMRNS